MNLPNPNATAHPTQTTRTSDHNLDVDGSCPDEQQVRGVPPINTGKRAGTEVAEVYVGEPHARVPRPVKELKGFAKVFLKPGESKSVSVELNRRAFSYYDVQNHGWTADAGEFDVSVGRSSAQIELIGRLTRQNP